jgi:hypothetical protein
MRVLSLISTTAHENGLRTCVDAAQHCQAPVTHLATCARFVHALLNFSPTLAEFERVSKVYSLNLMDMNANLASAQEGAQIVVATSSDERHPPTNILDG